VKRSVCSMVLSMMLAMMPMTVLITSAAGCRRNGVNGQPGESADAAAAGSGYGVGRPGSTHILGDKNRMTGQSATGNPEHGASGRDAGGTGDGGAR
jgi:hypothetical protein